MALDLGPVLDPVLDPVLGPAGGLRAAMAATVPSARAVPGSPSASPDGLASGRGRSFARERVGRGGASRPGRPGAPSRPDRPDQGSAVRVLPTTDAKAGP